MAEEAEKTAAKLAESFRAAQEKCIEHLLYLGVPLEEIWIQKIEYNHVRIRAYRSGPYYDCKIVYSRHAGGRSIVEVLAIPKEGLK